MENYLNSYESFNRHIIYDFNVGDGGIGDYIKFFIYAITLCMKHNLKICYKVNNVPIEKCLKLKHKFMYIQESSINKKRCLVMKNENFHDLKQFNIVKPWIFYEKFSNDCIINFNASDIFYFSDEVICNVNNIISLKDDYISFHVRLGDKFLETDKSFINPNNLEDKRAFSEETFFKCLKNNAEKNVLLFCDNNEYKNYVCKKFNNVSITSGQIGHTDFKNTTEKQFLDTITEFYILCNSSVIYAVSNSGFPFIASLFCNATLKKL
jgi:hypothetical protein